MHVSVVSLHKDISFTAIVINVFTEDIKICQVVLYLNSDTELRQEDYKNRLKQLQIRIKRCDRVIVINL